MFYKLCSNLFDFAEIAHQIILFYVGITTHLTVSIQVREGANKKNCVYSR